MSVVSKTYSGDRTIDGVIVRVNGDALLPGSLGFEWGYEGANPLELSRAILADHLGDKGQAEILAPRFMRDVVANFANEWQMTSGDIELALKAIAGQTSQGGA